MQIGIPREIYPEECRVAVTPEVVSHLTELGFTVKLETNAGKAASFSDAAYIQSGAVIVTSAIEIWESSDILLKVRAPSEHPDLGLHEASLLSPEQTLICFIWPGQNPELLSRLSDTGAYVLAMDAVPRISRAQKFDALSSMANVAGYRAIIESAGEFGRFFAGQITAAGKVPPARILVIGAGVAGLAAIGAAGSMGASVRAFDTRPEVKEQVESMGAEFLMLDFAEDGSGAGGYAKTMSEEFIVAEMALFMEQAKEVDIIITTALVPGKPAPRLITAEMVDAMRDGSVIVDLASEQGGNCELTQPGRVTRASGVRVIGYTDLPSRMPAQSSQLYGTNIRHFLAEICPDKNGQIELNMDDDVVRSMTVTRSGEITWPPPKIETAIPAEPSSSPPPSIVTSPVKSPEKQNNVTTLIGLGVVMLIILGVGAVAPSSFMNHFTVFILAIFVGWQVVWNVTPALHTPLMSVTNAISGIIVIGALLKIEAGSSLVVLLAAISLLIASINISGGFLVTHRMLRMFRRDI
ncbi:MAG: Re/Si-specific NAD(P)(+) transhydrogenase subunit alpha [Pseudomonadota bacterium]|nr:Re/Si-specific NAD(P)(+) transhydrogenase subunit alpha [Pseudomonadota bacterium]